MLCIICIFDDEPHIESWLIQCAVGSVWFGRVYGWYTCKNMENTCNIFIKSSPCLDSNFRIYLCMVRRLLLFFFFGFVSCLLFILIYFLFTVTFFFGFLYDLDLFLFNFVCLSSVFIPPCSRHLHRFSFRNTESFGEKIQVQDNSFLIDFVVRRWLFLVYNHCAHYLTKNHIYCRDLLDWVLSAVCQPF